MSTRHDARSETAAFWAKVDKSGDCWLWTAERIGRGYGRFRRKRGRKEIASRVSWEFAFGPIPPGIDVLHRCDNPPCVNPDHLFLGTHADNMRDMHAKGRWHRIVQVAP